MKKYLNESEVAELTGLAIQTLRNWRHCRKGPGFLKISSSVRYDQEEVIAFMDRHKVKTDESIL